MTRSVEASASLSAGCLFVLFTHTHADLRNAAEYLHWPTNGFDATAARRALIEQCVEIADRYGHEVRHDAR